MRVHPEDGESQESRTLTAHRCAPHGTPTSSPGVPTRTGVAAMSEECQGGAVTSTNAIAYEAIQRVFRNAVVAHIRVRLTERYGSADAEARVANAFPSWADIKAAAAESAQTGVVSHPHADEFSYLDVSHFSALFNNDFEAL